MTQWPVDFGSTMFSEDMARRCRGYNPEVVKRVWAQRRKEAEKIARAKSDANRIALTAKNADPQKLQKIKEYVDIDILDGAKKILEADFSSIKEARQVSAAIYGINESEMNIKGRSRRVLNPRHAAICAVKMKWPEMSLPFIAKYFNMDNTSILHALRKQGIDTKAIQGDKK